MDKQFIEVHTMCKRLHKFVDKISVNSFNRMPEEIKGAIILLNDYEKEGEQYDV